MTLTELGIEGAIEAPDTSEQRQQMIAESEIVQDFLNNSRDVGLIKADQVADFIVSPEYGDKEAELFCRLGKLAARSHHSRDPRSKIVKQDVTEFGDTVYSIMSHASRIGKSSVKSLVRVDSLFVVGHSHTLKARGTKWIEEDVQPLRTRDVNEFVVAAYRASRCSQ